jgi:hypothetical protein
MAEKKLTNDNFPPPRVAVRVHRVSAPAGFHDTPHLPGQHPVPGEATPPGALLRQCVGQGGRYRHRAGYHIGGIGVHRRPHRRRHQSGGRRAGAVRDRLLWDGRCGQTIFRGGHLAGDRAEWYQLAGYANVRCKFWVGEAASDVSCGVEPRWVYSPHEQRAGTRQTAPPAVSACLCAWRLQTCRRWSGCSMKLWPQMLVAFFHAEADGSLLQFRSIYGRNWNRKQISSANIYYVNGKRLPADPWNWNSLGDSPHIAAEFKRTFWWHACDKKWLFIWSLLLPVHVMTFFWLVASRMVCLVSSQNAVWQ